MALPFSQPLSHPLSYQDFRAVLENLYQNSLSSSKPLSTHFQPNPDFVPDLQKIEAHKSDLFQSALDYDSLKNLLSPTTGQVEKNLKWHCAVSLDVNYRSTLSKRLEPFYHSDKQRLSDSMRSRNPQLADSYACPTLIAKISQVLPFSLLTYFETELGRVVK